MPLRYKFLLAGLKSQSGNHVWKIGKWYKIDGKIDICSIGFHCSKLPLDALNYVRGEVIAHVECRGHVIKQDDKDCWSEMRIKQAWRWTKEDSVAMAIFAAELVIANFESAYPRDDRPRKAIDAAKAYLAATSSQKKSAADSAADSAVRAAYSAADSAAASAAYSAAYSAAARAAIKKKINAWMIRRIKTLKPIE